MVAPPIRGVALTQCWIYTDSGVIRLALSTLPLRQMRIRMGEE